MNWDIAEAKWDQFKAVLRTQWGKLTDDDIEQARGRRDHLLAKIQEHYGEAKDAVESKLDELIGKL